MPAASRRALRGCARFSCRAWQGSRSAPRVVGGYSCDSSRGRIRRRPGPDRCASARKPLRRPRANSRNRATGCAARSATTGTADPDPPRQRFLPVRMHPPHEKCADRSLRQACRIDRHAGSPPSFSAHVAQPAHRLPDRPINGLVVQTHQKTIQSCEIGYASEPQRLAQLAVFAQPHLGFARGPVLLPHPAENGQQLRLVELVLAETASVTREHRLGGLQGDASKRQESDFGHYASCLGSKQQIQSTASVEHVSKFRRSPPSSSPIGAFPLRTPKACCVHAATVPLRGRRQRDP